MAPKRKSQDMTAEERLESQRERNRNKQAALRARRAARLKELEEENAKLAAGVVGEGSNAPVTGRSSLEGAVDRLSGRLRQLGVSEGEIQALITGSEGGQGSSAPAQAAQPGDESSARAPQAAPPGSASSTASSSIEHPSWNLLPPNTSNPLNIANLLSPDPASGSSFSNSMPSLSSVSNAGAHQMPAETSFPFSFLFSEDGTPHPDTDIHKLQSADPGPFRVFPSPVASNPSSTGLTPPSYQFTSFSPPVSSTSTSPGPPPNSASSNNTSATPEGVDDLASIERSIKVLLDRVRDAGRQKRIGGREGLFEGGGGKPRHFESAKDEELAATQLLILQLLGATSSQKQAYDDQANITAQEADILAHGGLDERVHFLPNPAFRVRLGEAAKNRGLKLSVLLTDLINDVRICGDVWDWTGWSMPPNFMLQLPADSDSDSSFFPTPLKESWHLKGTIARPKPDYLKGSTIREIILGLEQPGAREAGPFATTCTVQLVEDEIITYTQM